MRTLLPFTKHTWDRTATHTVGLLAVLALSASCAPRDRDAVEQQPASSELALEWRQPESSPAGDSTTTTDPAEAPPTGRFDPSPVPDEPPPTHVAGAQAAPTLPAPTVLHPFPHVEVRLENRAVLFDGVACLDAGWLEFIVCTPGTKEHESLIVTRARPSHLHAALLLIGLKPGSPGRWVYENDRVSTVPPTGDAVLVEVIYTNEQGQVVTEPIRRWIRDHLGENEFPDRAWVFGGSRLRAAPPDFGVAEIYEADYSGSVIGLVTFGDEMLCFPEVLPDQVDIRPPEWEVNTRHVPRPGTVVTVVLRPAGGGEPPAVSHQPKANSQ